MDQLLWYIPTTMKRGGQEWAGPCPWCGGKDRFILSPDRGESGLWWCRRCERGGDGIDLLQELHGLSFQEARDCLELGHKVRTVGDVQPRATPGASYGQRHVTESAANPPCSLAHLRPPGLPWQEAAGALISECYETLCTGMGVARPALDWLRRRGFEEKTIQAARLGLNPRERWPLRTRWGLPPIEDKPEGGKLWLPRGIVIPWQIEGMLWKVNVRRLHGDIEERGGPKYVQAAGKTNAWSTNALYGASALQAHRPAVLVEGELDALAIRQVAGDPSGRPLAVAVATGSTHGARHVRWIGWLATSPLVLVSFDADRAGEEAAGYWLRVLPQARRWRPYWGDPAEMLASGADVRAWLQAGLAAWATEPEDFKA